MVFRYRSESNLAITLMPSLQLNHGGFVHAQIMLATMPNANTYMQLNFIAEANDLNSLI